MTGTRITTRGFEAPTPTTMVNAEDLQKSAQPNIFTCDHPVAVAAGLERNQHGHVQHFERLSRA